MTKKGFFGLALAILVAGGAFAQREHKHEAMDMLLGINWGFDAGGETKSYVGYDETNVQLDNNLGVNYDFYILPYLSVSTGLSFGPTITLIMDDVDIDFGTGLYMTVPFMVHGNIPFVEWLYLGIGVGLNIPLANLIEDFGEVKYFTSLPIDIGFDFSKTGTRAGGRFVFRIQPNFHPAVGGGESTTIMTYGFVWQFHNWKIFGKK